MLILLENCHIGCDSLTLYYCKNKGLNYCIVYVDILLINGYYSNIMECRHNILGILLYIFILVNLCRSKNSHNTVFNDCFTPLAKPVLPL